MRQIKITPQITNRDYSSLNKYLNEISRLKVISADEETELARRIKRGDQAAMERLIISNLRFVVSVAKQYQNQGLTISDLVNEGNIGLIKAAERYDESRGFKFISYAVWWIRQAIMHALAEKSRLVRLPHNKINSISKAQRELSSLEQEFEREPDYSEIAEKMEMKEEEVKELFRTYNRTVSMDAPIGEDEDANWYDIVKSDGIPAPDASLDTHSLTIEIEHLLKSLNKTEAEIIKMFYGIGSGTPKSLEEIGEKFSLSRERVRQIKDNAMRRLRKRKDTQFLKSYL